MKKTLLNALLCSLLLLPAASRAQSTVQDGQSTEGKDFWVTFLKADQDANNDITLSLSISARENSEVLISNPYTGYVSDTIKVEAGKLQTVDLYTGSTTGYVQRANDGGKTCYSFNSESVDTCALHVVSTGKISLFASNYKKATFDATNVLPTPSLLDSYVIQTYSPSDHKPVGVNDPAAGSHFAIVAAEDDVIVDITLSAKTYGGHQAGETFATETLKQGQVYYVWTGNGEGLSADLSGTKVRARDGKKIAVFQGNPHTNVPYPKYKERDHLFSQAMPTQYWGNTFVLSSSKNRKRDIFRVMALEDGTEVSINGEVVHTFDFSQDTKQYWEFELGDKSMSGARSGVPCYEGPSCLLKTSCPSAVHLFVASKSYDGVSDGDPAMLWVNPIEQQIDQVTFATYQSKNGTTHHYANVVTDRPASMTLDGSNIANDFKAVGGSGSYYYAQLDLGTVAGTHTLKSAKSNFIAHVYGFTSNESYGYSAGGATKPLTQYITINGQIFTPDSKNTLCGEDTIKFACHPDYEYEKIEWYFGDGQSDLTNKDSVPHYYEKTGTYDASVLIYRESSNLCAGQNAIDTIPITVTIGRYEFSINNIDIPCPEDGKDYIGKVYYSNPGQVDLLGDNVTVEFDAAAKAAGFKDSELEIKDSYFQIKIPTGDGGAKPETVYGIHLVIVSDCGGADTTMHFMINFDNNVIDQRYDNVLGLLTKSFEGRTLSDFQWYRVSNNDTIKLDGQVSATLNFYDLPYGGDINDSYFVCFTIGKGTDKEAKTCACAKAFANNGNKFNFGSDSTGLTITATYAAIVGGKVFVNADYQGQANIECYAQWINASGQVYQNLKFDIPDGGCTIPAPAEKGLYLLRVVTGKGSRSFKFIINQ